MNIEVGDKIQVKAGSEWCWGLVKKIHTKPYTIPLYEVSLLHGDCVGERVVTPTALDRAKPGVFIDHRLPARVNTA